MIRANRRRRAFAAIGAAVAIGVLLPVGTAAAHPLGNFSVNHLSRLTLESDVIRVDVVVDTAEIPTAQDRPKVDSDGDGLVDEVERDAYSDLQCSEFASAATLSLDGSPLDVVATSTSFEYEEGQAALETSRLRCAFDAAVPSEFGDRAQRLEYSDGYRPGRVGWHEVNAVGAEVGIVDSPVPATSVTNDLRSYPEELLESPLDVREVTLDIGPDGELTDSDVIPPADVVGEDDRDTAADARDSLVASRPGWLGGVVDGVQDTFDDMVGRRDLTLGVGLLAIGLSLVLGASHAVLPGHGKTVMAAYIAGRQGSVRDAVLVGATVTLTHTGGVLLLGLGLTISTALAGETVLSYLGVASGLLIAGLGVALLVNAVRRRDDGWFGHGHHHHGPGGHTHDHDDHGHDHHDGHDHDHQEHGHRHADDDHHEGHDHPVPDRVSRSGLVGMGVAGGLVPSPSALIVLLSAIALGRTWFGVVLVLGYGVGMAAVLTLAGVALVKVRDRLQDRLSGRAGRVSNAMQRWGRLTPYLTAALVIVVGTGLAIRSLVII